MKKSLTRKEKLNKELLKVQHKLYELEKEKEEKEEELKGYCDHYKLNFDNLVTGDIKKLKEIYKYFDKKYPVEFEGGIRCDDRGMALTFWLNDDPNYIVVHITSNHTNIVFSGSTSWLVKAPTLSDKADILKIIRHDISKIIEEKI